MLHVLARRIPLQVCTRNNFVFLNCLVYLEDCNLSACEPQTCNYYFQRMTIVPLRTFSAEASSINQSAVNTNVQGLSENVVKVPSTRKIKYCYLTKCLLQY